MGSDQSRNALRSLRGASLALLAGLGLVIIFETALQLLQLGPENSLFVKARRQGETHYTANREVAHRFFQRQYRRDLGTGASFTAPKPSNTVRIFILGASTVVGFPNPPNTAFPRFLEQMLADVYPSKRFEVINCGLTAINTFCVLDFVEEVVDYSPDLIIIYSGHNEFVGPYGVTTPFTRFGNDWHGIRLYMNLQRTKIYYGLKELIFRIRSWREAPRKPFGLHLVDREIGPHDDGYETTRRNFRRNLEEMLIVADEHAIPIALSTLVSNLKDFHPLRSQCDGSGLSVEIEQLASEGQLREAERVAARALESHPHCADIHFQLGQVRYRRGQYSLAADAFVSARDLDRMPFRAPASFNRVILDLVEGSDGGVLLNDVEEAFAAASPHRLVGSELITEYLHPTVYGHFLIARTLLEALAQSAISRAWGPRQIRQLSGYASYTERLGYSLRDQVFTRNYLIRFLASMPYRTPPALLRAQLASLIQEQGLQISRLDPAARRVFVERGEMAFLRSMADSLVPEDRALRHLLD